LADEMGLGKTITTISLIHSNPLLKMHKFTKVNDMIKLSSKATLVLCPSHLAKQWESEIQRCNPDLKVITILTKNNYTNLIFDDFINSDIIITSHQFIMNFKFYPTLNYRNCTASNFDFNERKTIINQHINYLQNKDYEEIKNMDTPLFEYFNFHRIVLDEGHEIFGCLLSTQSLSNYMSKWITNINSNYYWYVSGTPFINNKGLINCMNFIHLKLYDKKRNYSYSYNDPYYNTNFLNRHISDAMCKIYIVNNILNMVCIKHNKKDVENEIKIPNYIEEFIWVKFTDIERRIYESKKMNIVNIIYNNYVVTLLF
jgi:DNA repair protein RAD5